LIARKERPSSSGTPDADRKVLQDSIAHVDVHEDHLAIRLKSTDAEETSESAGRAVEIRD
jgi:site-specific DNA recombinase